MSHFDVLMDDSPDVSGQHPIAALLEDDKRVETDVNNSLDAIEADFIKKYFSVVLNEKSGGPKTPQDISRIIEHNVGFSALSGGTPKAISDMLLSRARGGVNMNAVRAYKLHLNLKRGNGDVTLLFQLPEEDQVVVIGLLEELEASKRQSVMNVLNQY